MRTRLGEFREFGDLDTPARVIGEMKVKAVEAIASQQSDDLVDKLGRPECSCAIEHKSTPCEGWYAFAIMWDH